VSEPSAPPGYESFLVGRARVVAHASVAAAVRGAMSGATLHEWASRQPGARGMQGRATAWSATMPGGIEVVVRHSRHGGMLAPLTGDLFLTPTRAPAELRAAQRLAKAGVPTAEVLAYAIYPAMGPLVRSDVMTRLLRGTALPEAWQAAPEGRQALVGAVTRLLSSLRRAGALHPDLNARNVLVLDGAGAPTAAVLDVDRVAFGTAGDIVLAKRNARRLIMSMSKPGFGLGLNDESRRIVRTIMDGAEAG